jgi:tRNA isopentenyl-2-thiomethyl-A-37 hydroxylase MiaE
MIEFKTPQPEQIEMMREFANAASQALMIVEKYEVNNVLVMVANKIQEAMHWFQSGILNDVVQPRKPIQVAPIAPSEEPIAPIEQPNDAA